MKISIVLFILILLVAGWTVYHYVATPRAPIGMFDEKTLFVLFPSGFETANEVAVTPEQQALGLGGRDYSMRETDGMLFLFDPPTIPKFWMKGMKFDLDMIWLNGTTIVGIEKNVPKESFFTLKTFSPNQPVTAVLEVNAGVSDRHGIKVGDVVEIGTGP